MKIEIKKLREKDHKQAIKWAISGMHFNTYIDEGLLLNMYGKYFWYSELLNATQVISAYYDNQCVGVLLARMNNERKVYHSFRKSIYVKAFDILQKLFAKGSVDIYDITNKKMLDEYKKKVKVDGEIVFLAATQDMKIKGVGTKLLEELGKREKGKEIYLYTDDFCTYQFYDHRGFKRVGEENIKIKIENKEVNMTCMLYGKKL